VDRLVAVDPALAAVVVAPALAADDVVVRDRDETLDEPLRAAAARSRTAGDAPDVTAAVRTMYKRVGLDPTKTRPSSEALLRRVRRGDELPRVNSLVDVVNWCSLESQLPFGLYDRDHISGDVTLRLGRPGEEYAGIRKDVVHVAGRLTLADAIGPFGNPTSDSVRTMVTPATTRALVVVFAPPALAGAASKALEITRARIEQYCGGRAPGAPHDSISR
jgi:DNA/RNA-binding domain of Phe-tRNA-synthetase-like protein